MIYFIKCIFLCQFFKEIYPGKFKPSLSHRFIHNLEKKNKLLRNYTQNIDTLEREAGITRVIECHGKYSVTSAQDFAKCKGCPFFLKVKFPLLPV